MTATLLAFPPQPGILSTVNLLRLDGTPFRSQSFLPSHPEAAWSWIVEVVAAELDCALEEVGATDDAVTVDGLPCYMVEIIRPACFSQRMKC
jgi:hypothetical protein